MDTNIPAEGAPHAGRRGRRAFMIREDYLLRQVTQLVAVLARALGQGRDEATKAECAAVAGLGLDVAVRLGAPTLIQVLTGPDGLDAPRALALGIGLGLRALDGAPVGDTAAALLPAAVAAAPDLDQPDARALREPLA